MIIVQQQLALLNINNMNNIQQVIEESLKGFDKKFGYLELDPEIRGIGESIKSHINETISNILTAIEVEVEGKKQSHQEVSEFYSGYNTALADIQELLKSAKENIK